MPNDSAQFSLGASPMPEHESDDSIRLPSWFWLSAVSAAIFCWLLFDQRLRHSGLLFLAMMDTGILGWPIAIPVLIGKVFGMGWGVAVAISIVYLWDLNRRGGKRLT
jgi:hypothetical protein